MDVFQFESVGSCKYGEVFEWCVPGWVLNHKYSTKRSDVFTLSRVPDFKFCLTLRPYTDVSAQSVSINLHMHRIRIVTCGSNTNTEKTDDAMLGMEVRFILLKSDTVYKWSGVMKMEDNMLTANFPAVSTYDFLNVQCTAIHTTALSESDVSACQKETSLEETKHEFVNALSSLLNNGNFSDITLHVQGKDFKAHRCILAARSTVFAAMFNHDLKEKLENRVVIDDISSDAIQQLLKYLYTDEIDELTNQQYLTLLAAADKYDIVGLRKICSHYLKKNLTVDALVHILVAADLHHENELKEAATQLFLKDPVPVMNSDEWFSCLKNHTALAHSVMLRLAKR